MLEARVAALETHVEYIKRDVGELRADMRDLKAGQSDIKISLATLTERVLHLPTFGKTFALLATFLALLSAVTLFQDWIKAKVGITPPAITQPKGGAP